MTSVGVNKLIGNELSVRAGFFLSPNINPDVKVVGHCGIQHDAHWLAFVSAFDFFKNSEKKETITVDTKNEAAIEFILKWLYELETPEYLPAEVMAEAQRIAELWEAKDLQEDLSQYKTWVEGLKKTHKDILEFGKAVQNSSDENARKYGNRLYQAMKKENSSFYWHFRQPNPAVFEGTVAGEGLWGMKVLHAALQRAGRSEGAGAKGLFRSPSKKMTDDAKGAADGFRFRSTNQRTKDVMDLEVTASDNTLFKSCRLFWLQSPMYAEVLKDPDVKAIEVDESAHIVGSLLRLMSGEELPPLAGQSFQQLYSLAYKCQLHSLLYYFELTISVVELTPDLLEWSALFPDRDLGSAIMSHIKQPTMEEAVMRKTYDTITKTLRSDIIHRKCSSAVQTVACLALAIIAPKRSWNLLTAEAYGNEEVIQIRDKDRKRFVIS